MEYEVNSQRMDHFEGVTITATATARLRDETCWCPSYNAGVARPSRNMILPALLLVTNGNTKFVAVFIVISGSGRGQGQRTGNNLVRGKAMLFGRGSSFFSDILTWWRNTLALTNKTRVHVLLY